MFPCKRLHKQSAVRLKAVKMVSPTRSIAGGSGTTRPRGRYRSAHVMVLAWIVFWVNTALFPCCEALAAAFGHHSDTPSQSVSAAQPSHLSDDSHSKRVQRSPESPCENALNAEPATTNGQSAALPADRFQWVWFAVATSAAPDLRAVNHAVYLALRDYHPPPPFRLYLHTQRLLI